ncbi:MAG: hypothetical protein K6F37_06255 [Lachnospiraceae bacterium]|nr:hypothetical protein [Lachnospiraceae bacterium]
MKKGMGLSSVKGKLIISMVLIAAIPLALATFNSYMKFSKNAKDEAQITLNWSAWYIEGEINDVF